MAPCAALKYVSSTRRVVSWPASLAFPSVCLACVVIMFILFSKQRRTPQFRGIGLRLQQIVVSSSDFGMLNASLAIDTAPRTQTCRVNSQKGSVGGDPQRVKNVRPQKPT